MHDCGREDQSKYGKKIGGCQKGGGAWPHDYYNWLMYRNGRRAQMEFCSSPYLAKDLPCNDNNNCDFRGAHLRKYHMVEVDNEVEVEVDMKELVYIAPIVTTVLTTQAFRHYEQGVLDDPECCEKPRKTFQKMKIA